MTPLNPTADQPARRTGKGWVDDADLLQAVLTHPLHSHAQIAALLGCEKHTVSRRYNSAEFQQKLNAARDAKFEPARAIAVGELQKSVAALVAVRDDPDSGPRARIAAATALIEIALKLEDRWAAANRIARLEAAVENLTQSTADPCDTPLADAVIDLPPDDDADPTAHPEPANWSPEVWWTPSSRPETGESSLLLAGSSAPAAVHHRRGPVAERLV